MVIPLAARPPRVVVFDWISGGHHESYLVHAAAALSDSSDVVIAAPAQSRATVEHAGEFLSLGEPRPRADPLDPRGRERVIAAERDVFLDAARRAGATHAVHMFADEVAPLLARAPRSRVRISLAIFRASAHYPRLFNSYLFPHERKEALALTAWLSLWRQRRDAGALLLFDEYLAHRLAHFPGAPAVWLPEAPVRLPEDVARSGQREGVVLVGALAWRKGIEQLADAISHAPTDMLLTLAGRPMPDYVEELQHHVERMRAAGADVILRPEWIGDDEYLRLLAKAKVAAVPYPRHRGMSRVLVEAAAAGTPVVADRYGLLGQLVREYGLGLAVAGEHPAALRSALERMLDESHRLVDYGALERFAARYTDRGFREALAAVLRA